MVQFTLPKNSKVKQGKAWNPPPEGAEKGALPRVPHLPLRSGHWRKPAARHLLGRHERLRADGSRRADLDQEQRRPDPHLPPLLPRGRVRLLLDEYRRHQHARLHAACRRRARAHRHLSLAASAGDQGPRPRSHPFLRPAPVDRAVAQDRHADAAKGMAAEPRRPRASSTGSTSASCAPAARPPARLIGGTATAISVLPSSCRPIAGSRTAATSAPASGSTSSKIPSGSIAATPSSIAPRPAPRGSTRRQQSPRSSGNWWSAASDPRRLSH